MNGCTLRHLDLILQPVLERLGRWHGRAPAMLLDPKSIASGSAHRPVTSRRRVFAANALGVVLHELAHVIDAGPAEPRPQPAPQAAGDEATRRALAHPEVQRFREVFPGAEVRVVRNHKTGDTHSVSGASTDPGAIQ